MTAGTRAADSCATKTIEHYKYAHVMKAMKATKATKEQPKEETIIEELQLYRCCASCIDMCHRMEDARDLKALGLPRVQ